MSSAVLYERTGGPEVLEIAQVDPGVPGPGQILVRVEAAGINPFDFKVRRGIAPSPDPLPRRVGVDFAGTVQAVGPVASFDAGAADRVDIHVGDEVLGWGPGSLTQLLLVDASQVAAKPADLSMLVAGSLTTPGLTAAAALDVLDIGATDTVLVSAAAGAVGLLYCQLAIARGARVIGTASPGRHDLLRQFGVEPVEYGPGLADRVRALTDRVTAVQDNFGRETIDAGLELGVPPQRICSIVDHAAAAELGLASPGRYRRDPATLYRLAQQAAAGDIRLPIQAAYPMTEVVRAFEHLETRHLAGKIVVLP